MDWTDEQGKQYRCAPAGKPINFRHPKNRALRAFVYRRDRFACVRCGWAPPSIPPDYDGQFTIAGPDVDGKRRELQLDHIIPIYLGGNAHPDNLQTLCFGCNASKQHRAAP